MALIIEDGSGVANANSYVTLAEAVAYAELRGDLAVFANDDDAIVYLIKAVDYLETISDYQGITSYNDQVLLWPRSDVWINTLEFDEFAIPPQLKKAQIEVALAIASGIEVMPNSSGAATFVKKEKVGSIETEYAAAFGVSGEGYVVLPQVDALLNVLRGFRSPFRVVRV